jgi:hypothetical protein
LLAGLAALPSDFHQSGDVMYTLIKSFSAAVFAKHQLPALLIALTIAQLFYKFHSFILECVAFLATWFVLDWALSAFRRLRGIDIAPRGL